MLKLARWCSAHRRLVVVGWIVVFVVALGLSSAVGPNYGNSFSLPGTDSQRAADLLSSGFRAQSGDVDQIVFHTTDGTLAAPATRARVEAILARVGQLPHVDSVLSPYSSGSARDLARRDDRLRDRQLRRARRRGAQVRRPAGDRHRPGRGRRTTLQVELGGQAIEQATNGSVELHRSWSGSARRSWCC